MDVTVDTSVVIAVIANEPEKQSLIRMTEGADLIAPHSVHWEIGNRPPPVSRTSSYRTVAP